MNYGISIFFVIASGLIVNGVHAWLLWSQRHERKWSISVHAAKDKQTYKIYLVGHLLAGLFFALFAYDFYVNDHDKQWLFWLTCVGLTFEYIQAILPAKGKTNMAHAVTAYAMFISYAIVAILSLFHLPLSRGATLLAAPFLLAIPLFGVVAVKNRDRMYASQMVAIGSFSLVMIIMAFAV